MDEITSSKTKSQIWQERIEQQARSGRSVRVFCGEQNINPRTFCYWRIKLCGPSRRRRRGRFIAVRGRFDSGGVPTDAGFSSAGSPRIHLPNGVRIELGAGLESPAVGRLILGLCGVGQSPEGGTHARS